MTDVKLGLADVLEQLGAELRDAASRGGKTISWLTAEVEMEVAVEITASGGVQFWVVNGEAARSSIRTTRIKVNLHPTNGEPMHAGM